MKNNNFLRSLAVGILAVAAMAGCATQQSSSQSSPTAPSTSEAQTTQQSSSTDTSKPVKLVVYSPQGDETRGQFFIERAKKDIGIEIEFLCAGGGELADRLRAEKANPQADVMMGLIAMSMYQLRDEDLFVPYVPSWADDKLPAVYKEKDGYFHGFWQTPIVIGYNPEFVPDDKAPKDWLGLDDQYFEGKYNIGGIGSQTIRSYLAGILYHYYDPTTGDVSQEGWDYLKRFYQNTRVLPSGADSWTLVKSGEMPVILSWYDGIVTNCEKNEIPVKFVVPEKGTPIVDGAVAIVKGTKNMEAAQKFVEWIGSPQLLADFAKEFGSAPAHPDAIALCPENVQKSATTFKAQDIDWEVVSKNMDKWLQKIELEIMP